MKQPTPIAPCPRSLLLALITLGIGLPGCQHTPTRVEVYNLWKLRCYELSEFYEDKLKTVPYHSMANRDADRCSTTDPEFQWDADKKNMHILVANFFYHYDMGIRRKALEMLEAYHCEKDKTCKQLAQLFDQHIAASLPFQPPAWKKELHQRARDFYRYLLTKR